jgi:hypothetical protein
MEEKTDPLWRIKILNQKLAMLANHFISLVEQSGFEPPTYTLRTCRSPS